MKKILFSILTLGALMVSSCSMDTEPQGVQTDENAISNFIDCQAARLGLYAGMRGFGTGGYVYLTELQTDMFCGTVTNGNRNGEFGAGTFGASTGDIASIWYGCYSRIGNINFFLAKTQELLNSGKLDADQVRDVNGYIGEAHFARAMYYLYLFDHFCQTYSADKANTPGLGVPLVTEYAPSPDRGTYKGRSTMAETFKLIDDDLTAAFDALASWEDSGHTDALVQNSAFVSTYTVEALQARAALLRGDGFYDIAVEKADNVINASIWTLSSRANYGALWSNDQGTELIFRPYVASVGNREESGISSTGGAWLQANGEEADYVPLYENCIKLYDDNDIRADVFFDMWELKLYGVGRYGFVFNKFPGNAVFDVTIQAIKNMPKMFRLSEMVLIKAEAAQLAGDETTANDALEQIRKARIQGYRHTPYSGDALRDEIRLERTRELIGEGFRMSDLRRWNLGFRRDPNYPISSGMPALFRELDKNLSYSVGDHRYVWPIPQDEIETNPQIAGQQNPGY